MVRDLVPRHHQVHKNIVIKVKIRLKSSEAYGPTFPLAARGSFEARSPAARRNTMVPRYDAAAEIREHGSHTVAGTMGG